MSRRNTLIVFGLAASAASSYAAVTNVVGPLSCPEATMHTRFDTIGDAIASSPPGATILVCPGIYPEQLTIAKKLTIRGVANTATDEGAAVITVPSEGLATMPDPVYPGYILAPQVLVTTPAGATISNLTIDGGNNGIASCAPDLIGIAFINSPGTVSNSSIVNQLLDEDRRGCQGGEGVLVESNAASPIAITLNNNHVANFNKNGITIIGNGVTADVRTNVVLGIGPSPDIAQNGIQISGGATGSVTSNVIGDMVFTPATYGSSGVIAYNSPNVLIQGNAISNTQLAVEIYAYMGNADGATITGNYVQGTKDYDAVDLCGSSNHIVTNNRIFGTDEAAIHVEGTTFCGPPSIGNVIKNNTINAACAGILVGPGASYGPMNAANTFFNVGMRVMNGSDVCPAAEAANTVAKAAPRRKPSPAHLPRARAGT